MLAALFHLLLILPDVTMHPGQIMFNCWIGRLNLLLIVTGLLNLFFQISKPSIDIVFQYTDEDISSSCNGQINESKLKATRYSTLMNQWADMAPDGTDNPANNTVAIYNVSDTNFWAPWTLVEEVIDYEMFLPNAFTPNADGT